MLFLLHDLLNKGKRLAFTLAYIPEGLIELLVSDEIISAYLRSFANGCPFAPTDLIEKAVEEFKNNEPARAVNRVRRAIVAAHRHLLAAAPDTSSNDPSGDISLGDRMCPDEPEPPDVALDEANYALAQEPGATRAAKEQRIRQECSRIAPVFFQQVRKTLTDKENCILVSYLLSHVLSKRCNLAMDGISADRVEMEVVLKLSSDALRNPDSTHVVVAIYLDGEKALLADASYAQFNPTYCDIIYVDNYAAAFRKLEFLDAEAALEYLLERELIESDWETNEQFEKLMAAETERLRHYKPRLFRGLTLIEAFYYYNLSDDVAGAYKECQIHKRVRRSIGIYIRKLDKLANRIIISAITDAAAAPDTSSNDPSGDTPLGDRMCPDESDPSAAAAPKRCAPEPKPKGFAYYYRPVSASVKLCLSSALALFIILSSETYQFSTLLIGAAIGLTIFGFALLGLRKRNRRKLTWFTYTKDVLKVLFCLLLFCKYPPWSERSRLSFGHDVKGICSRLMHWIEGGPVITLPPKHERINEHVELWTIQQGCTYYIARIKLSLRDSPFAVEVMDKSLKDAQSQGAMAAVNGGYSYALARDRWPDVQYNYPQDWHVGLVKIGNRTVSPYAPTLAQCPEKIGDTIFGVKENGSPVIRYVSPRDAEVVAEEFRDALQLGPMLIWDGKIVTERKDEPSGWSFVGLTQEEDLILGSMQTILAGTRYNRTHREVAEQLMHWAKTNGINIDCATSCDGGSFAGLVVGGGCLGQVFRGCPNSIWVVPRFTSKPAGKSGNRPVPAPQDKEPGVNHGARSAATKKTDIPLGDRMCPDEPVTSPSPAQERNRNIPSSRATALEASVSPSSPAVGQVGIEKAVSSGNALGTVAEIWSRHYRVSQGKADRDDEIWQMALPWLVESVIEERKKTHARVPILLIGGADLKHAQDLREALPNATDFPIAVVDLARLPRSMFAGVIGFQYIPFSVEKLRPSMLQEKPGIILSIRALEYMDMPRALDKLQELAEDDTDLVFIMHHPFSPLIRKTKMDLIKWRAALLTHQLGVRCLRGKASVEEVEKRVLMILRQISGDFLDEANIDFRFRKMFEGVYEKEAARLRKFIRNLRALKEQGDEAKVKVEIQKLRQINTLRLRARCREYGVKYKAIVDLVGGHNWPFRSEDELYRFFESHGLVPKQGFSVFPNDCRNGFFFLRMKRKKGDGSVSSSAPAAPVTSSNDTSGDIPIGDRMCPDEPKPAAAAQDDLQYSALPLTFLAKGTGAASALHQVQNSWLKKRSWLLMALCVFSGIAALFLLTTINYQLSTNPASTLTLASAFLLSGLAAVISAAEEEGWLVDSDGKPLSKRVATLKTNSHHCQGVVLGAYGGLWDILTVGHLGQVKKKVTGYLPGGIRLKGEVITRVDDDKGRDLALLRMHGRARVYFGPLNISYPPGSVINVNILFVNFDNLRWDTISLGPTYIKSVSGKAKRIRCTSEEVDTLRIYSREADLVQGGICGAPVFYHGNLAGMINASPDNLYAEYCYATTGNTILPFLKNSYRSILPASFTAPPHAERAALDDPAWRGYTMPIYGNPEVAEAERPGDLPDTLGCATLILGDQTPTSPGLDEDAMYNMFMGGNRGASPDASSNDTSGDIPIGDRMCPDEPKSFGVAARAQKLHNSDMSQTSTAVLPDKISWPLRAAEAAILIKHSYLAVPVRVEADKRVIKSPIALSEPRNNVLFKEVYHSDSVPFSQRIREDEAWFELCRGDVASFLKSDIGFLEKVDGLFTVLYEVMIKPEYNTKTRPRHPGMCMALAVNVAACFAFVGYRAYWVCVDDTQNCAIIYDKDSKRYYLIDFSAVQYALNYIWGADLEGKYLESYLELVAQNPLVRRRLETNLRPPRARGMPLAGVEDDDDTRLIGRRR